MKQVIIEQVKIEKLVPGGQALGELSDGRKVFVWGALPNETVKVQLTKSKKHYAEAVTTEILTATPERIEPRDECYLSTSPWQIMTETAETKYKSELVTEAFRQEHIELPYAEIKGDGKFWQYRNKIEYSLWWDHDTAKIWPAFHRRGSHQKILVKSSNIERPEIWAEAQRVINQLNADGEEARKYQSLLIRCNQAGQVSGALFENGKSHPTMANLTDTILGEAYTYSPNGFFQINLPVYEMALNEIKQHLDDSSRVVDMYSGVGTIGLSVARDRQLTLVETDNSAFRELQNNVPSDRADIRTIHAKSEEALDYITSDACIIVDPPRAGLDNKVVGRILETQPKRVIYLSCNPATQARDVALLSAKYSITYAQPFNFFPRTPHIENLIVLRLK